MSNADQRFELRKIEYLIPIIGMVLIGITAATAIITSRKMQEADVPIEQMARVMGALMVVGRIEAVVVWGSLTWCVLRWARGR